MDVEELEPMIVPSDTDYIETKLIKLGRRSIAPLFKELADWIAEFYPGVTVLNIHYDNVASTAKLVLPRLSVIFEWEEEAKSFRAPDGNFDPVKQAVIAAKFRELLASGRADLFDTHRLLVIFCAFEPVARLEAIWGVTQEQIAGLEAELNNSAIWKIRGDWAGIVVFFYTDAQLRTLEETDLKAVCSNAYAEIIGARDEFGYFRDRPAVVTFDSKENFEANYQSNWFNYDRR